MKRISPKNKNKHVNDASKNVAAGENVSMWGRVESVRQRWKKKEESKDEESVLGIPMDFMQNLPLPQILLQEVFYFHKLCRSVFGTKA